MKKNQYYKNKIQYALQKIDYAKARMENRTPDNILTKIYLVMENYSEIDFLTMTKVLEDIPADKVKKAVKYLNDLGVLSWEGKRLSNDKIIRVEEKDYSSFVKELEQKMKKSTGKERLNLKELKDIFTKADEGDQPKQEKTVQTKDEQWVEIEYSQDVIMKVKKSKLKKLLE